MSVSHSITRRITTPSQTLETVTTITDTSQLTVSEAVNDGVTDLEIAFSLLIANLKSIYIRATQDMTLKTNSSSTPDETINLVAGQAYLWHTGSYFTNLLATNLVKFFVSNASGTNGTFDVEAITDATP